MKEMCDAAALSRQSRVGRVEVTSEMKPGVLMIKHHAKFNQELNCGTVLAAQFGAESNMGYLQPVLRLVNLTPEKDICIEHRNDPVRG